MSRSAGVPLWVGTIKGVAKKLGVHRHMVRQALALAFGSSDAAAVRHLLTATELVRSRPEPFQFSGLEQYERPLPPMQEYDRLLHGRVAAAEVTG